MASRTIKRTENASANKTKREIVLDNYDELRGFYQDLTTKSARWFMGLQVITLLGAALTPVLLLTDISKLLQALPSAFAGLAAAINVSFRFRQEWAQNYVTLSALMNECQRFRVAASPDYSGSPDDAVDNFQRRLSEITMAEVTAWRNGLLPEDTGAGDSRRSTGGSPR